jgi:hypothetical protein
VQWRSAVQSCPARSAQRGHNPTIGPAVLPGTWRSGEKQRACRRLERGRWSAGACSWVRARAEALVQPLALIAAAQVR